MNNILKFIFHILHIQLPYVASGSIFSTLTLISIHGYIYSWKFKKTTLYFSLNQHKIVTVSIESSQVN